MFKRIQTLFILLTGLICLPVFCFAQAGRAELSGTIQDPSGLPVPKAKVEAEDQATMVRYSVLSDERGEYHVLGLPAGQYVLTVEQPGFRKYRQSGITLRLADRTALDVKLEVGQPTQSVEVTAAAPLLQTTSGEVSLNVEEKKITTLPLDGRNFIPLGDTVARRRPAQRPVPAAHQRQQAAHERIHLRRHQRAAARAGAGGLLPDHRRHGGIQAQRQCILSRVRPVERRHRHGHRKIR